METDTTIQKQDSSRPSGAQNDSGGEGFSWRWVAALAFLGASLWIVAFFFRKNGGSLIQTAHVHPGLLLASALCVLATRILDGLKLRTMARAFSVKLSTLEWLGFGFVVPYYNLVVPKGGVVANAAYLNRRHKFSLGRFASLASGGILVTLFVNSIFGIGAVLLNLGRGRAASQAVLLVILAPVLLACLLIPRLKPVQRWEGRRWLGRVNQILQGWHDLRKDRPALWTLLGLQTLMILIFSLRYYFLFRLLTSSVAYGSVVASSAVTYLSNMLVAVPGNMGVRELVTSLGAQAIGQGLKAGAIVSILDRSIVTLITFTAGAVFHLKLVQSLEKWERRPVLEEGSAP